MINKHILLQDSFSDEMGHTGISALEQEELSLEKNLFIKYRSSYSHACYDFVIHIFLLFLLFTYFNNFCCIMFLSLLNVKTFIIFHDCCHGSYTDSKIINYLLSHITGIFIFTSPNWKLDHDIHHLTNGLKNNRFRYNFNETVFYTLNDYKKMNIKKIFIFNDYRIFFTLVPFLYFWINQRFIYILKKLKYKSKILKDFRFILLDHIINNIVIFILFYYLYKYNLLFNYLISIYITHFIGIILFHNQHTFNISYVVDDKKWNIRDSGIKNSSFIQIPIYLKYFTGGVEYHHVHHVNSKIHSYNLQKYHEEIIEKSNIFNDVVKLSVTECFYNLKLRLYDEENNKYIRLDEI